MCSTKQNRRLRGFAESECRAMMAEEVPEKTEKTETKKRNA